MKINKRGRKKSNSKQFHLLFIDIFFYKRRSSIRRKLRMTSRIIVNFNRIGNGNCVGFMVGLSYLLIFLDEIFNFGNFLDEKKLFFNLSENFKLLKFEIYSS